MKKTLEFKIGRLLNQSYRKKKASLHAHFPVLLILTSMHISSAFAEISHNKKYLLNYGGIPHKTNIRKTSINPEEHIVSTGRRSRSEQSIGNTQMQRLLPGINPLQALNFLPGVTYNDSDPWGNTERSASLFVHGFNQQQLGYTLDGVPLGDQIYGNDNGLSPQRAAISENFSTASIATGAGALSTASTSNLGGTMQFMTDAPQHQFGGKIGQTFGSFSTFRTYARVDTGDFNLGKIYGNSAYVSWARQDARAWDSGGHQGGNQINLKLVHKDENDKVTYFFDWSDKNEASADGIVLPQGYGMRKRPYIYPDFPYAQLYPNTAAYKKAGLNFRDYYTDAMFQDFFSYLSWDHNFSSSLRFHNQIYYHHNQGEIAVSGPLNVRGLSSIFDAYFPGQSQEYIRNIFGDSGYETRTTEYWDNRGGIQSSLDLKIGKHIINIGGWYERNDNTQARRWYPVKISDPSSPYRPQRNAVIDQFTNIFFSNTFVTHVQDVWKINKKISFNAGFKSELIYTNGTLPVAAKPASLSPRGATTVPGGEIDATKPFLPAVGVVWDITRHEQTFVNIQENMRAYQTSGYGTATPWGVTSQKAFEDFKKNGKAETAWEYEAGFRTHGRQTNSGFLNSIDAQLEYYHVHYSNRLLAVSTTYDISSIIGSATILTNVGSVNSDGVDFSFTGKIGDHFSFYNALSYNKSVYNDNYMNGRNIIHTSGKNVSGNPDWSDKFIVSAFWGDFYAQLSANVVGKRYATFTNDLWVSPYAVFGFTSGYAFYGLPYLKGIKLQMNVTNLTNEHSWSSVIATQAASQTTVFPNSPRMFFLNISTTF